jgi:hypothetical protein
MRDGASAGQQECGVHNRGDFGDRRCGSGMAALDPGFEPHAVSEPLPELKLPDSAASAERTSRSVFAVRAFLSSQL